jgi:hypothetical protein
MKGNFHVRFLGEGAAATPLPYPTLSKIGFWSRTLAGICAGFQRLLPMRQRLMFNRVEWCLIALNLSRDFLR